MIKQVISQSVFLPFPSPLLPPYSCTFSTTTLVPSFFFFSLPPLPLPQSPLFIPFFLPFLPLAVVELWPGPE